MSAKVRIKKGDKVIVLAGKDKGKQGQVLKVLPSENRAKVAGINMVKRHSKPAMGKPGGIMTVEMPIHLSNIACVDPKSGKASRIGYKMLKDGKKVRVAKKSGEVIDN